MNPDFVEMLAALSEAEAEFMIVGAHAVAAYSRPRATGDLDIWVRATPDNAARVWKALVAFGAPLDELTESDLATEDVVYQIGVVPSRIDILTSIEGVAFAEAWPNRTSVRVGGTVVDILGREDLIRNKRALGRERDLADLAELENPE
jgi:hypothetical protein